MNFRFIDNIVELTRGERIVAVKAVSLSEEYLADHFPTFPVMPGVLILEAMIEAGGWLVRDALDFRPGVILLREARNVTYKSFVRSGRLLRLEVTCRRMAQEGSDFTGIGYCNQTEVVRAKFGLRHFCLGEKDRTKSAVDKLLIEDARSKFTILCSERRKSDSS